MDGKYRCLIKIIQSLFESLGLLAFNVPKKAVLRRELCSDACLQLTGGLLGKGYQ